MIEVFRTNVTDEHRAQVLLDQIHEIYGDYTANFDLSDREKILRVKNDSGLVCSSELICLLSDLGCQAEILPDTIETDEPSVKL